MPLNLPKYDKNDLKKRRRKNIYLLFLQTVIDSNFVDIT